MQRKLKGAINWKKEIAIPILNKFELNAWILLIVKYQRFSIIFKHNTVQEPMGSCTVSIVLLNF